MGTKSTATALPVAGSTGKLDGQALSHEVGSVWSRHMLARSILLGSRLGGRGGCHVRKAVKRVSIISAMGTQVAARCATYQEPHLVHPSGPCTR